MFSDWLWIWSSVHLITRKNIALISCDIACWNSSYPTLTGGNSTEASMFVEAGASPLDFVNQESCIHVSSKSEYIDSSNSTNSTSSIKNSVSSAMLLESHTDSSEKEQELCRTLEIPWYILSGHNDGEWIHSLDPLVSHQVVLLQPDSTYNMW